MNYGGLKQAIQDYTETTETTFVANIPLFIKLAEERILKTVRLDLFQRNQSAFLSAGNQYLATPVDFLAPLSILINVNGNRKFMELKDLSFVQEVNEDPAAVGVPRYFGVFDTGDPAPALFLPASNFILAPTPDLAYPVELQYFYRPPSLTSGSDISKTWLSENASLSLLYGALLEAYTFLKGEGDMMQLYATRFEESIMRLKDLGEAKEPTTDYRYGRLRVPRS